MKRKRKPKKSDIKALRGEGHPTGVGDILGHLRETTGLGRQLEQAQIWEAWPQIVGKSMAPHGRPVTVKERTLYVEAESPVWMHRFAYCKWDIIKHINGLAKKELVSDVFITLADDDDANSSRSD